MAEAAAKGPSEAMEAWSRFRISVSSPTTSPSSSTTSSPASLHPPDLLDVTDDLWFYRSVVPLPSLPLPCFPTLLSSSPESSTLIAQCMISHCSPPSAGSPTSSTTSKSPQNSQPRPPVSHFLPDFAACPAPPDGEGMYASPYDGYDEEAHSETDCGGYWSESDEDEDNDHCYPRASVGEDEDTYYYDTAPSDWDDDNASHGNHVPCDCEDKQQKHAMKKEVQFAEGFQGHMHLEPDDALSGIYDAVALLKDQHQRTQEVSHSHHRGETVLRASHRLPKKQEHSDNEQGELKENIKLWAHLVASTLAAQARPVL